MTSRSRRYRALIAALLLMTGAIAHSAERAYPNRPIRLVLGFPPGGSTDALARIISPKLTDLMGQNWIVDNRAGAGGNLAAEIVSRGNPDGYTVLLALNTQLTAAPSLYKLPFSVEKDLQPITTLATHEHIVLVHPNIPARSFKEFVALARQKPGALNYGSSGIGGSLHLAAELLKKRVGFEMTHVAYKGAGPAIAALLAGETQAMVGAVPSTYSYVTSGRFRALATTGPKRHKVTADLPTIAELGYPGFENIAWFGLFVPKATPEAIAERIYTDVLKALQQSDAHSAMARLGLDRQTSTPAELAALVRSETATYAAIIKEADIRGE
jgi:tripartite-type tricarboxylate transporter receptor subunit TctC